VAHPTEIEILGSSSWPLGLPDAMPRRTSTPLKVLITPQTKARQIAANLRGHFEVVTYATSPSAIEAAVLIAAGVNAYVTRTADLAAAIHAVCRGETWFSAVAAAAVCRLARLTCDPALQELAVAARSAAAGQPWPQACRALGLNETRRKLQRLRSVL
jgi:DNA-binding NarL/FixJ family response regulator